MSHHFPRSILVLAVALTLWSALSFSDTAPVCAQAGCSTPSFNMHTTFAVGTQPGAVVVGDFNSDSNVDLVTVNGSHNISVLLGNGAGSFGSQTTFPAGLGPHAAAVADFNTDGKSDIAVTNQNPSAGSPQHRVSILIGAGDGSFAAPVDFAVGQFPLSIVATDFNADGKMDVAAGNSGSKTISVLLGNGAGGFATAIDTSTAMIGFTAAIAMAAGDFNGDGKIDLAAARENENIAPGNLTVFLGTGTGTFTTGDTYTLRILPSSVVTSDLNADGKSDLAVTNRASGVVGVLLGTGSGTFSAPVFYSVGSGPQSVTVGDFNLDGNKDLAVANQAGNNNTVSVLIGDGAGSFTGPTNFAVGPTPGSITSGDFNEDGKSDLATANFNGNNVSVLINSCSGVVAPISLQFNNATFTVAEDNQMSASIQVTRTGITNQAVTVDYATVDDTASERSDYTTALGTLSFAAGETEKTFVVLINEDSLVEGTERFTVALSNPTGGAALGGPNTAAVQILDDGAETSFNVIDDADHFVIQNYHDFLNRQADPGGLAFWRNEITSCGSDPGCIDFKRANVSQAFFLSIEFQRTGYQVFRIYKATFVDSVQRPRGLPRFREFLRDTQKLQRDVVVGQGMWEAQLAANLDAFVKEWVNSAEFVAQFPAGMTAAAYVDKLFLNSQVTPTTAERNAAIGVYADNVDGRAAALRSVTDSGSVYNRQFNPAFVLMQYIGYLRRNPNDAPEPGLNYDGYDFWLTKLNQFSLLGEDVRDESVARARALRAEMVRAFLLSGEYRQRFGQ